MKIDEYCQALEVLMKAESDSAKRIGLLSSALQKSFKTKDDELAIFTLDQEHQEFHFLWPPKLVTSGTIPANLRGSLLTQTAHERKPLLNNRFEGTRHASVFEMIPLATTGTSKIKKKAYPIQKIMSVPVLDAGAVRGVMQLSRKGPDQASSGPDFTPAELDAFASIATAIAPHIPW